MFLREASVVSNLCGSGLIRATPRANGRSRPHGQIMTLIMSATRRAFRIDRLGPKITYVPGSQFTATTTPTGAQTVQLDLPDGIPPGTEGYLEFQAEYHVH